MPFVSPSLAQLLMAAGIPAGIALALFVARGFGHNILRSRVGIIPGLPLSVLIGFYSGMTMLRENPETSGFPGVLFATLAPFAGAFLSTFVVSVVVVWWISIQSTISRQTPAGTHFAFLESLPGWIERMNPIIVGLFAGSAMIAMYFFDGSRVTPSAFAALVFLPCLLVAMLLKVFVCWIPMSGLRDKGYHELIHVTVGFVILGLLSGVPLSHPYLFGYFWGTALGAAAGGLATLIFLVVARKDKPRSAETSSSE